ncbi:MAG TPA: hypothetical protein VI818_00875, partial [Candidatus Thermoplasmatota archaeon]|nr:hypothetical protein [Candidatus Thermoplasmatota archaeon]
KRWRLDGRIEFRHMGAESLTKTFGPRTFDVVLHTLVANNLQKRKDAHFRAVASVMKPDALLILQERVTRRHENQRPGSLQPLAQLRKYFDLSAGILTHLPEHRAGTSSPGYARVALWLGRPRR